MLRCFFLFLIPLFSFSHSGNTDSSGGHTNRKTGKYHYHHGCSAHQHSGGVCTYNYRNCRNDNYRNNTTNKKRPNFFVDNFFLFLISGFFLLYAYANISDMVRIQRFKRRRIDEEKEFAPEPRLKKENNKYPLNQKTIEKTRPKYTNPEILEFILDFLFVFGWVKYTWLKVLLRIIIYPLYAWGFVLLMLFTFGFIALFFQWLYNFFISYL